MLGKTWRTSLSGVVRSCAPDTAELGMYCANLETGLMWSWEEFMEAVKVVGCDRIVIGTDCGHFAFPAPVEAMRLFITGMLMRGIPDNDVEKMVKTNPSELLY